MATPKFQAYFRAQETRWGNENSTSPSGKAMCKPMAKLCGAIDGPYVSHDDARGFDHNMSPATACTKVLSPATNLADVPSEA